jgi:N-acetylmuramoyl-L-alanine amidase
MKFLIDNEHGENTPGKRSPVWPDGTQLFEWEYAREIARRVETELLKRKG